jgi:predicted porin
MNNIIRQQLFAAAIVGMAATGAYAQSSVTLYGLIDTGVSYVNHSATTTGSGKVLKYADGVDGGSRWGLKGAEDLGNGLKAVFTLESGFGSDDGTFSQGGALFGRQADVGVKKTGIGELTFGRQYVFSHDYVGHYYSTGGLTAAHNYAYHINTLDQLTASRVNNSVKFSSENFAGLTFGAMYAFSNQPGAFEGSSLSDSSGGSSRAYSFGINYKNGPFGIGAAYTDISFPSAATPAFNVAVANVDPGDIKDLRTFGIGSRYKFGKATVYGLWTNTHLEGSSGVPSSTLNVYEGGGLYAISSLLTGALGYTHTHLSGGVDGSWNQFNSSLDYKLSKLTNVYLLAIYQKASGSNGGVPVQAQIGKSDSYLGVSGDGTDSQLAFMIGFRHKF